MIWVFWYCIVSYVENSRPRLDNFHFSIPPHREPSSDELIKRNLRPMNFVCETPCKTCRYWDHSLQRKYSRFFLSRMFPYRTEIQHWWFFFQRISSTPYVKQSTHTYSRLVLIELRTDVFEKKEKLVVFYVVRSRSTYWCNVASSSIKNLHLSGDNTCGRNLTKMTTWRISPYW